MLIEPSILPTPVAQVARRLNIIGNAPSADAFLAASYLAETAIKILAIALYAGLREKSPDHAYRDSGHINITANTNSPGRVDSALQIILPVDRLGYSVPTTRKWLVTTQHSW